MQACELYQQLSGGKPLKPATTPFCPEGSFLPQDDEEEGELAGNACKILMKCLWLARLARPDIIKAIPDKALFRMMCYIHALNPQAPPRGEGR